MNPLIINAALLLLSSSLGSGATLWFMRKSENEIKSEFSEQVIGLHERVDTLEQLNTQAHEQTKKHVVREVDRAFREHLSEHTEHIIRSTEELKEHARLVMDTTAQRSRSASTQRVKCSGPCGRVVYRFNERPDGTFLCLDCEAQ
jgi:transposase